MSSLIYDVTLILRNEKNRMKNIYWEHMNTVLIPALWQHLYQKSKNYVECNQFKLTTIKYAMHVLSLQKQLQSTQKQLNLHHTRPGLPCTLDKSVDKSTTSKTTNISPAIISTPSKTPPSSLPITSSKSNIHLNTTSSKKSKFKGTNPNTSIANFKEWCKNKEKKIKLTRDEFKQLKINHKFSEDIYNKNCEWFEYIKNNMTI